MFLRIMPKAYLQLLKERDLARSKLQALEMKTTAHDSTPVVLAFDRAEFALFIQVNIDRLCSITVTIFFFTILYIRSAFIQSKNTPDLIYLLMEVENLEPVGASTLVIDVKSSMAKSKAR